MEEETNSIRIVTDRTPRKDTIRIRQSRLPPLRRRARGAFCVVVEADDYVSAGRVLQVFCFLLVNQFFFCCLSQTVSDRLRPPTDFLQWGQKRTSFFSRSFFLAIKLLSSCLVFS
jgi:hypothetical protein